MYDQIHRREMSFPPAILQMDPYDIRLMGVNEFEKLLSMNHPYVMNAVQLMAEEHAARKKIFDLDYYLEEQRQPGHMVDDHVASCILHALGVDMVALSKDGAIVHTASLNYGELSTKNPPFVTGYVAPLHFQSYTPKVT